jgi:hypothetical protein
MLDTERLLDVGERGIHLLFDADTIHTAFAQDADRLRGELAGRVGEVHFAIEHVVRLPSLADARRFIGELSPAVRYVLVLLYFELLDGRVRGSATLH